MDIKRSRLFIVTGLLLTLNFFVIEASAEVCSVTSAYTPNFIGAMAVKQIKT